MQAPELRLLIMVGAEQPIRRTKVKGRKKEDYSGKKKAYRKKHLPVSSHERRIVYRGPTSTGSEHDKKLADEKRLELSCGFSLLLKDTGVQSY